jgi:toxin ParE1/3/4
MTSSRSLHLSAEAGSDLRSILDRSANVWGHEQRDRSLALLHEAFDRLMHFPEIGRERDDLSPGVRSYRVGEHTIWYRTNHQISVVRVLHRRMSPTGVL